MLLGLFGSVWLISQILAVHGLATYTLSPWTKTLTQEEKAMQVTDLACPFTYFNTFIIPSDSACTNYVSAGTTGQQRLADSGGFFSTGIFIPQFPCATVPTQVYSLQYIQIINFNVHFTVISQSTTDLAINVGPITGPFQRICVYPVITTRTISTTQVVNDFTETITQTGFVDVTDLVTTTQLFSATFTFTTTRTFFTTQTSSTTETFTVDELSSTTLFTSSTITYTTLTVVDIVEQTTTTTFVASTRTVSVSSTLPITTEETVTENTTKCVDPLRPNPNNQKRNLQTMIQPADYPRPVYLRADQAQCPIQYAGSVYNSNPGSSMTTVCNVAGGTQVLTDFTPLYTWLWNVVKTFTPCAYAPGVLWIGSSTGTCFALDNGSTTSRPCSEIHPVICLSSLGVPTITIRTTEFVTPFAFTETVVIVVTRTATFTVDIQRTQISSIIITVPSFVDVTTTRTRVELETETLTTTRTLTGYALTTTTRVESETIYTQTNVVTSAVLTRTVSVLVTVTSTSTISRTVTNTVNSCPKVKTQIETVETTTIALITSVIPVYSTTVYTTETTCLPEGSISNEFTCCG